MKMVVSFCNLYRVSCLIVILFAMTAFGETEQFSVESADGKTCLNGQIDWPEGESSALVIMVAGTGLFDRHVLFGNSDTEKDLLFQVISDAMVSAGLACLRYDMRGVDCNERTHDADIFALVDECIDIELRQAVVPATMQSDVLSMFEFAAGHHRVDPDKIIGFGHSEGCLHMGRLLRAGKINPKAFMLMGISAESPKSLVRWQLTERMVPMIMARDGDGDGVVTNAEITAGGNFLEVIGPSAYYSPTGSWREPALLGFLVAGYEDYAAGVLAAPDDAPHGVMSAKAWWKMYFADDRSCIDDYIGFDGPIAIHNGDYDSQTPAGREFEFVRRVSDRFAVSPRLVVHHGRGHSLGPNRTVGPISDDSLERLVADLLRLAE